jgi:integrase
MVGCLATKHVLPAFGKRRLCDLSRADFQDFIHLKHREGYSSHTVAHLRNLLSRICATAVMRELLAENLARGLIVPRKERRRPFGPGSSCRVLTLNEVSALSKGLAEQLRLIVMFGVLTGLRIGEILALRLEDFDLSGGFFTVRRNVYQGHVQDTTKTSRARQMPIAGPLMSAIEARLAIRPNGSEWLFPSEAGTPYHDRNLLCRRIWPVCDQLGILRFGWHSLRHTFSTFGGNNGVPLPVIQSLLGHSSAETTMLYTHPLAGPQREAVEKLAVILFPNVPTEGHSHLAKVG